MTYDYDAYGWPINPVTGEAWDFAELVADPTLPLPRYSQAVQRARDKACPERSRRAAGVVASEPKRKRRTRRSRSHRSTRQTSAATMLARAVAAGPFEVGIRATARRMDELAEKFANKDSR